MKSSHLMEKPFSCHCGASYTLRQSLLRHQTQHRREGMKEDVERREGRREEEEEEEGQGEGRRREISQALMALDSSHPRPVRGRPRKTSLPQLTGETEVRRGAEREEEVVTARRGEGEEAGGEQEGAELRVGEQTAGGNEVGKIGGRLRVEGEDESTMRGGEGSNPDVSGQVEHTVVYVQTAGTRTGSLTTSDSAPLLLTAESPLPQAAGQELVEVVISEAGEQCILVHGQQTVGELVILQEEGGLCSVAQTVEIETV